MTLLETLRIEAERRGLLISTEALDAQKVFELVREMPYRRASDRRPETILSEWQGTCSGKHYLLQALLAELGIASQVIACTTTTPVSAEDVAPEGMALYQAANRRFVDVHNYLLVSFPGHQPSIVDATWPLAARQIGLPVNETLAPGQDQILALSPIQSWAVPPHRNPQEFKNELLHAHFTPAELQFREEVLRSLSRKIGG